MLVSVWKRRACPLKRLYIIFHTHGRMGMATSTFQSLSLAETHFLHLPLVPSPCLCVPCESAWPTATHNRTTIPLRAAQPSHETRPRTTPRLLFPPLVVFSCQPPTRQHTPSLTTLPSSHSVTPNVSPLPPSSKARPPNSTAPAGLGQRQTVPL
ncbi:hypothetical protein PVAP13_1NG537000 [Panicum virgatum]|uniref:Uncharacterized protein n=1 Tax=Panicum virgatum TaxID=38727 RepID=A0A8T0X8A1_PANVG|nr:hypothetical protein PVAP13_1NG537000 [Panicum virgatum]